MVVVAVFSLGQLLLLPCFITSKRRVFEDTHTDEVEVTRRTLLTDVAELAQLAPVVK